MRKPPKHVHLQRVERSVGDIDQGLRQAIRSLVVGESPWPLFLEGPAGVGKTCAALCLLDHAGGEYCTVSGLCSKIIQSQQGRLDWSHEGRGGLVWPEQIWAWIAAAPLLVLDEIGCRDRVSDAHYEAVKRAIDERAYKPFVAISNLPIGEVEKVYDDRIYSRLAAGTVVRLEGQDRRVQ